MKARCTSVGRLAITGLVDTKGSGFHTFCGPLIEVTRLTAGARCFHAFTLRTDCTFIAHAAAPSAPITPALFVFTVGGTKGDAFVGTRAKLLFSAVSTRAPTAIISADFPFTIDHANGLALACDTNCFALAFSAGPSAAIIAAGVVLAVGGAGGNFTDAVRRAGGAFLFTHSTRAAASIISADFVCAVWNTGANYASGT